MRELKFAKRLNKHFLRDNRVEAEGRHVPQTPRWSPCSPHTDTLLAYLTASVYKVVLQKSIPTQVRQLILYISNNKG